MTNLEWEFAADGSDIASAYRLNLDGIIQLVRITADLMEENTRRKEKCDLPDPDLARRINEAKEELDSQFPLSCFVKKQFGK